MKTNAVKPVTWNPPVRLAILAFALGVLAVSRLPALPGGTTVGVLAAGALVLAFLICTLREGTAPRSPRSLRNRRGAAAIFSLAAWLPRATRISAVLVAALLAGFAWASFHGHWRLHDRLPPALEGRDLVVTGVVATLPQPFERGVRFELDVESASLPPAATGARVPRRIALSWFNGLTPDEFQEVRPLRSGERWRLAVRLKRPHGNANPHGFDYEAWLTERGIDATGYVRPRGARERLAAFVPRPAYAIERAREHVRDRFLAVLGDSRYAGVLVALAVGDQRAIVSQDWDIFTRTGVGHLMSISGLHVTMVSGFVAALVAFVWRRSERLALALPAQKAAAVAAVAGATGYCLLAGFQVPAQRTLYMVMVVAAALWLGRLQSSSRVLALSLLAVLAIDPFAVTSPGFWLSFAAVAAILYVAAGGSARGDVHARSAFARAVAAAARTQWAVTLGLAPLAVALFQQVSLVSPVANAVAIPVVSFVVTPLALAAALVPWDGLLVAAHAVLDGLMVVLDRLAALPGAVWQQHVPPAWAVGVGLAGVTWMLAPRGVPSRWIGALLLLPLFLSTPARLPDGAAEMAVLDVGQGLAVVVRTRSHVLVYDTGPRYSLEADAGNRVVVPYLRAVGLSDIDALMITHDDVDHSGGAASVARAFPTTAIFTSLAMGSPLLPEGARYRLPCHAGQRWTWDGVTFEMLHPARANIAPATAANDASCSLMLSARGRRVLLTGDIEAIAERELLARAGERLHADVLLVPHHGSRTSSSDVFLDAVAPGRALVAAGYRNRFGHPKPEVLDRYRARGIEVLRTDLDGAIVVQIDQRGLAIERHRELDRRWWKNRAGAAP